MKSTLFFLAAALAPIALAQPHRPHHAKHHKRQNLESEIIWVTDYEYVTETVDITTTIWVSEGFVPPATTSSMSTSSSSSSSSSSSAASSSPEIPAQFFQPAPPSTSSVYVAPTPESTYVAPAPTTSEAAAEPVYTSPIETPSTTSAAPAYVPEPSSPSAVYTPPVETPTSAAAPASTSASSSSGSPSGDCTSGSPCSGDITYYQAGLGACGITSDGDNESVIALPFAMMGTQSNGNPYCGKTVTITCTKTGLSTTATIVDKCMGCTGNSIDLSNKAFAALDPTSMVADGRLEATWYFN